jgi:hypothetical protein
VTDGIDPIGRHAVATAQIAPVSDRETQILDFTPEGVFHGSSSQQQDNVVLRIAAQNITFSGPGATFLCNAVFSSELVTTGTGVVISLFNITEQ